VHCKASYGDAVSSFYRPRASCFSASPTSCIHTEHWSRFCSYLPPYQQSQANIASSAPQSVGPCRERLPGTRLDNAVQALLGQRRVVAEAVEVPRQRVEHRVRVPVHANLTRLVSRSFANGETGLAGSWRRGAQKSERAVPEWSARSQREAGFRQRLRMCFHEAHFGVTT